MKRRKANEIHFEVGDCVRVLAGIQDPDWGEDIGGWQGRVLSIERPKRGKPTVLNGWDSITLRQMSATTIEKCEVDGLDWSEYGLNPDEIASATCRDARRAVERTKKDATHPKYFAQKANLKSMEYENNVPAQLR